MTSGLKLSGSDGKNLLTQWIFYVCKIEYFAKVS